MSDGVVIIDDLHFEADLSPHVRKVVQTIGDTLMHEGDMIAIVSTGPSFIQVGPTYDKKLAMEAVGNTPAEFAEFHRNDRANAARIFKTLGIKPSDVPPV